MRDWYKFLDLENKYLSPNELESRLIYRSNQQNAFKTGITVCVISIFTTILVNSILPKYLSSSTLKNINFAFYLWPMNRSIFNNYISTPHEQIENFDGSVAAFILNNGIINLIFIVWIFYLFIFLLKRPTIIKMDVPFRKFLIGISLSTIIPWFILMICPIYSKSIIVPSYLQSPFLTSIKFTILMCGAYLCLGGALNPILNRVRLAYSRK